MRLMMKNTTQTLCKVCGEPIHPQRLAALPHSKTDKHECSLERKRQLRSASSARCHKRNRSAKKKRIS